MFTKKVKAQNAMETTGQNYLQCITRQYHKSIPGGAHQSELHIVATPLSHMQVRQGSFSLG